MESREIYQESYDYLDDIKKGVCIETVTIDFNKLDTKSKGELINLLTNFCNRRRGEIWNKVLSGTHDGYFN